MSLDTASAARTPTVRQSLRRIRFWVGFAVLAALIAVAVMLIEGVADTSSGTALSPTSAAPDGARALVRVLGEHGVEVTAAATHEAAAAALAAHGPATLLVYDPSGRLPAKTARSLARRAAGTVLVAPPGRLLAALAPGVRADGTTSRADTLPPRCPAFDGRAASGIAVDGTVYRIPATARGCFPDRAGRYALVPGSGGTPSVVGSPQLFENGRITRLDNAATAIGLAGSRPALVWYLPSAADVPAGAPVSLGALTPGWVTPVAVLLIATALAAIAWRGRRFGPLVAETLPVTVRARETMEGRARLYERGNARAHAAQSLRIGAIARIAARLHLPAAAEATDVADAAAESAGLDRPAVREILLGAAPAGDAELMALSAHLAELEDTVTGRAGPGTAPPRRPGARGSRAAAGNDEPGGSA